MNLEFLNNRIYAHRGYFDNEKVPENSIPAFKRAIVNNYGIELDVHVTKDNKIVVFHDHNLKRACGVNKVIEECTYNELLKYNLFNTNYKIPLLSSVLKIVNGKVPLLIEIKSLNKSNNISKLLCNILDNYNGSFAVQSFNPFIMYWFKKYKKRYVRGILLTGFKKNDYKLSTNILKKIFIDILIKPNYVAFNIKNIPNSYTKNNNKLLLCWTIKTMDEYLYAKKYCNAFICENMNLFLNKNS